MSKLENITTCTFPSFHSVNFEPGGQWTEWEWTRMTEMYWRLSSVRYSRLLCRRGDRWSNRVGSCTVVCHWDVVYPVSLWVGTQPTTSHIHTEQYDTAPPSEWQTLYSTLRARSNSISDKSGCSARKQLVALSGRRPLWSAERRVCHVPRQNSTFGDRSFAAAGPRIWNELPFSLRDTRLSLTT